MTLSLDDQGLLSLDDLASSDVKGTASVGASAGVAGPGPGRPPTPKGVGVLASTLPPPPGFVSTVAPTAAPLGMEDARYQDAARLLSGTLARVCRSAVLLRLTEGLGCGFARVRHPATHFPAGVGMCKQLNALFHGRSDRSGAR